MLISSCLRQCLKPAEFENVMPALLLVAGRSLFSLSESKTKRIFR